MTDQKYYPQVESNVHFPTIENEVLKYWKENNIFQKSISLRVAKKNLKNNEFIFYDGPPFANGLPHYGHLLTGFIKDVYARYKTTKGQRVERQFGWDCHGLPAEMEAEKELGFSGRIAITEYGVDKFNDHCRNSVMKYSHNWQRYVERQARWVDFDNGYRTMDKDFMESVLWSFKELYKKGLIYKSMRVMPYSWACETPLSNFETRLDNSYRKRVDKAVTVLFKIDNAPSGTPKDCLEYYIMVWTTTPWTLPSNLALAVGSDIEYVCVVKNHICYIVGKFAVTAYAKELNITKDTVMITIKGNILAQHSYRPLFNYFIEHKNAFRILTAEFVTEENGTGIVHIAPGFGEDDYILCQRENIEMVCPVDNAGKFTNQIQDFQGLQVFDANDLIIIKLKHQGSWIKTEQYTHNYPHCWRTDTPLIYKAVPSWYVKVTSFKDRMVELNQQINWIPEHVKGGLFGKWLENAKDWSISRNRFWGTPIPVWQSDDPRYPRIDVYGSIKELEIDFGVQIQDLHKPYIDHLVRPNPDDPTGQSFMRRVSDVFDCWFESGSMPYGQSHYPFKNKIWFENHFPADFIVEYSAQTRGWFYTLMVLSTALFDRPPFLNCICHGVILSNTGQKLSKRLNNYIDPITIFNKYGADALRVSMLSSTVVKGQELIIDTEGKIVFNTLRLFIKPIWNAYNFFCLYANEESIKAQTVYHSTNILDQYILSKLKLSIQSIDCHMDRYDSQSAYSTIANFFDILNNWYIRRSRPRFWKSEIDMDKITAYNTLYTCLTEMSKAISPLLPLISEHIYLSLTNGKKDKNSVHLTNFPLLSMITIHHDLVGLMDQVRDICSTALFIRSSNNIMVRQPLSKLKIITENSHYLQRFDDLIKDEINIKSVDYDNNLAQNADRKLSINFSILGKRLPQKMKHIITLSKQGHWSFHGNDLVIAQEKLLPEEYSFILVPRINRGAKPLSNHQGMVWLDLTMTKELEHEGIARNIIRLVQQARKEAKLHLSDRIKLELQSEYDLKQVLSVHSEFICSQTLSIITSIKNVDYSTQTTLLNKTLTITLEKIMTSKED